MYLRKAIDSRWLLMLGPDLIIYGLCQVPTSLQVHNISILFLLLHFHFDGLKKGCDLEQKMVQFGNKSHC